MFQSKTRFSNSCLNKRIICNYYYIVCSYYNMYRFNLIPTLSLKNRSEQSSSLWSPRRYSIGLCLCVYMFMYINWGTSIFNKIVVLYRSYATLSLRSLRRKTRKGEGIIQLQSRYMSRRCIYPTILHVSCTILRLYCYRIVVFCRIVQEYSHSLLYCSVFCVAFIQVISYLNFNKINLTLTLGIHYVHFRTVHFISLHSLWHIPRRGTMYYIDRNHVLLYYARMNCTGVILNYYCV